LIERESDGAGIGARFVAPHRFDDGSRFGELGAPGSRDGQGAPIARPRAKIAQDAGARANVPHPRQGDERLPGETPLAETEDVEGAAFEVGNRFAHTELAQKLDRGGFVFVLARGHPSARDVDQERHRDALPGS